VVTCSDMLMDLSNFFNLVYRGLRRSLKRLGVGVGARDDLEDHYL
jgi:hypothetical protein